WWFWDNKDIEEATDLQWFDLDGLDVVPRASGRLPGIVQDSFGIDVHDGTLRVAATTGTWGRWWLSEAEREPMMTHLVLLEPDGNILVPTGMVGGIAPGERLWSARFTDTRAYLITFEQIDPLWILDLTDTSAPKILGELEIPGVSTYIHPLSDELLLTIGMGPREDGTGLDRSRLQVSLFDIRDEAKPVRADVLELSPADGWSQSAALHEHKAFTYWDRLGMLAVPMATQRYDPPSEEHGAENNSTPRKMILFHNDAYLRLVKVDPETKRLHLHGDLRQSGLVQEREVRYGSSTIERSYFLGLPEAGTVSVYTMSVLGVTAHDLDTLEEQDHVRFGPPQFERYPHFRIR
ncbi:MAG: beta-propeller domain-containing protein, partial [Euryarchaeota archaeon]|nr:beta-propeller domain-containing protein [Euryarchaeota archaeon]